jgi:hypothetical protein
MKHEFTKTIEEELVKLFGSNAEQIYNNSELLQFLNKKTKSANKGSKARGSFGTIYAIYTLTEDYVNKGYQEKANYKKYEGARFTDLLSRAKKLPFGAKLQNHSFNQRANEEFKANFPLISKIPILRNPETKRYWINENLLKIKANNQDFNISLAIIEITHKYIEAKTSAFDNFISTCEKLKIYKNNNHEKIKEFILDLLKPNVDARIFEITSYAILKANYFEQSIFFGFSMDSITEENLKLYKTGRTNANDSGIDFVMKPLGRFFQVTETTDVKKYFLDIDKLEKFPITFVVKSLEKPLDLKRKIKEGAEQQYGIEAIVNKYMSCIEEIINIPILKNTLDKIELTGKINDVLNEIIKQSKVEFNYEDDSE